jgi:hypothetical protein
MSWMILMSDLNIDAVRAYNAERRKTIESYLLLHGGVAERLGVEACDDLEALLQRYRDALEAAEATAAAAAA